MDHQSGSGPPRAPWGRVGAVAACKSRSRPSLRGIGWRVAVAVAAAALLASLPVAVAAQSGPSAAPVTSTPVSASEVGETAPENAQGAQGAGLFKVYSFSFLGRPGSVQAGFDRYYWMTASGLGVRTACTGSQGSAGHCTWAEYYWSRTSTSGGSYLGGNNVPMYFDFLSGTVWLIFATDAPVRSGNWSGSQGGGSATVAISCSVHAEFQTDDWPTDGPHDDVWHDVKVCQGSLSDMIEQGGTASIPVAPDEFGIALLADSDRMSRAGRHTRLALRLSRSTGEFVFRGGSEPIPVTSPVANAPLRGTVSAGPSLGAKIMCTVPPRGAVPAPRSSDVCVTDASGRAEVRFAVPANAAHALRRGRDTLSLFVDYDNDGTHDHSPGRVGHEPSATIDIDIAKAINYVALGDSYSSGEAGETPPSGAYENDADSADADCHRWNKSYPYVFAETILGTALLNNRTTFTTYACTGAITLNVYDGKDPDGTSLQLSHNATNRPSERASARKIVTTYPGPVHTVTVPDDWEPRQAVSLAGVDDMSDVDMITITISGNDAGFADVLRHCVLGGSDCGETDLPSAYDHISDRLTKLLAELKRIAPKASIFLLGYPPITPEPIALWQTEIDLCGLPGGPLHASGITMNAITALYHYFWGGTVGDAAISFSEAASLWKIGAELNSTLSATAASSGVHFVDVLSPPTSRVSTASFAYHTPCDAEPWLDGFVSKTGLKPISDRSFHPNSLGHRAYAISLYSYIRSRIDAGARLNESGLPTNPKVVE